MTTRRRNLSAGATALLVSSALAASALAATTSIDGPASVLAPAERIGGAGGPTVGGCPVFPADNAWNRPVDSLALHPQSAAIVNTIQANGGDFLHPDFGENPDYGIPYVVVPAAAPRVPVDLRRVRRRERPRPLPDPARCTDRRWGRRQR